LFFVNLTSYVRLIESLSFKLLQFEPGYLKESDHKIRSQNWLQRSRFNTSWCESQYLTLEAGCGYSLRLKWAKMWCFQI